MIERAPTEESVVGRVSASGDETGLVTAARDGTAPVEPVPGLTATDEATLRWDQYAAEDDTLPKPAIERGTDDHLNHPR